MVSTPVHDPPPKPRLRSRRYFTEQSKTQAEALKTTVARYGVWPRGGGDDKAKAQNMSDGTVKDGDASWSRK